MPAPARAAVPAECASRQNVVSHADELAAIAAGWRRGRPLRIVAIGSSSTQGIGASSPDRAYPVRLAAALDEKREGWTFSIANLGVGATPPRATGLRRIVGDRAWDVIGHKKFALRTGSG